MVAEIFPQNIHCLSASLKKKPALKQSSVYPFNQQRDGFRIRMQLHVWSHKNQNQDTEGKKKKKRGNSGDMLTCHGIKTPPLLPWEEAHCNMHRRVAEGITWEHTDQHHSNSTAAPKPQWQQSQTSQICKDLVLSLVKVINWWACKVQRVRQCSFLKIGEQFKKRVSHPEWVWVSGYRRDVKSQPHTSRLKVSLLLVRHFNSYLK